MKNKIIYIFLFIVAFAFTTGGIVYLNSICKNIFKYNFSMATAADTTNSKDSTKTINASLNSRPADSLKDFVSN